MANEPISALTLFTSYSTADEVEILDVSDTTFASTGTNKRIPFSTLLTMAGVGSVQNESASTILGNPTGSPAAPSAITLYPNMGFVGTSLRGSVPKWAATSAGTPITNSTSSTSIFTGASSIGSLTIPANTLQVGSRLRFNIFGALSANATSSPTLTIKFLLGGVHARVVDDASSSDHLQWHRLGNLRLAHRFLGASDRLLREDCRCRGIGRLRVDRKSFQQQRPQRPTLPGHDQHDDIPGYRRSVSMVGGLCV